MILHFDKLILWNFRSFRGKHVLALNSAGVNFVCGRNELEPKLGSNGSGKSSLWGGLSWTLYGKTVQGLRSGDVKPWAEDGEVTKGIVKFRVGDKRHTVCREGRTNGLRLDGEGCSQQDVDAVLGLSFDVFVNSILFGQGQPLFFDLSPSLKLQRLSDVLGLERWERRADAASRLSSDWDRKHFEAATALSSLTAQREEAKRELVKVREQQERWDTEHFVPDADRQSVIDKLAELNRRYEELVLSRDMCAAEMKIGQERLASCDKRLSKLRNKLSDLQSRLLRAEDKVKSHRDSKCVTCGQPLSGKIGKYQDEYDNLYTEVRSIRREVVKLDRERVELVADNEAKSKQYVTSDPEFIRIGRDKEILQRELARIESVSWQENPYTEIKRRVRKRLAELEEAVDDKTKYVSLCVKKRERYKVWIKGFRDLRLDIVNEVLGHLESVSTDMLGQVGMTGWTIQYTVESETKAGTVKRGLSVIIKSPHSKEGVKWEAWSGGEGQRLRLIGALAFAEVLLGYAQRRCNLEVLDEPMTFLSREGVDDMCLLLAERAKLLGKSIWYTDHMTTDSELFASRITVVKDDDGSRIEP